MLITNRQAIINLKKLGKKAVGEITVKCLKEMGLKRRIFSTMMQNATFTLEERKIFDKICKPYFEIRPEVLEEQQIIK